MSQLASVYEITAAWRKPNPAALEGALVDAITDAIWGAASAEGGDDDERGTPPGPDALDERFDGNEARGVARVCLLDNTAHLERSVHFTPDGVTERVLVHEIPCGGGGLAGRTRVRAFVQAHARAFTSPKGAGALLLLYSALLSRGLGRAMSDMDRVEKDAGDPDDAITGARCASARNPRARGLARAPAPARRALSARG